MISFLISLTCQDRFPVLFVVLVAAQLLLQLSTMFWFGVEVVNFFQSKALCFLDEEVDEKHLQDVADAEEKVEFPSGMRDANWANLCEGNSELLAQSYPTH